MISNTESLIYIEKKEADGEGEIKDVWAIFYLIYVKI